MSEQTNTKKEIIIGLADADLLDGGTRHPNLALLKLAGFFHDNNITFELIEESNADVEKYDLIYISKVFTFTQEPIFHQEAIKGGDTSKFRIGGTGYYATISNISEFKKLRAEDMLRFEYDEFLNNYPNQRGGRRMLGIDMERQMPYYHLYDNYINKKINEGAKKSRFKDYLNYSIGFLTRGCFRHCAFCVNKLENQILPYSKLEWFIDSEYNKDGKLIRPYIYLWDDNFLASSPNVWRPLLKQLIETKRPFQFRQGLDERIIAESPYGEEIAETLAKCKYHGDYIFAFDNWNDREKIEKALKIWKRHNKKGTKFYLFCGYRLKPKADEKLYKDIWEIFQRIKILMQYQCLGYIMRHEDYHNHELSNIYMSKLHDGVINQHFIRKCRFGNFVIATKLYGRKKL